MRFRQGFFLALFAAGAAIAACTLNPQPLPPGDDGNPAKASGGADASADAGAFGADPEAPPAADAGATANGDGGAGDDGDGGDGGDGGDAGIGDAATEGG